MKPPAIGEQIYLLSVVREWGGQTYHDGEYQGETSRSWLVGGSWKPFKYAKKEFTIISREEWEQIKRDAEWVGVHRYKIGETVGRLRDIAKLRRIAEIVGYDDDGGAK